jgi:hypothetical protein
MGAATRKLSLVFFFRDRPYFRYLYPVIFLHKEGICERFLIKLTMPSQREMERPDYAGAGDPRPSG